MKKHPQDLKTILSLTGGLPSITEKSELLIGLNHQVKQILAPSVAAQIKVANFRNSTLIIEVTNSAWAARVNFQKKSLLTKLQNETLSMLTAIEIKVNPSINTLKSDVKVQHRQLTQTAADHINTLAEHADGSLKEKLKRLAKLANRDNKF